MVLVLDGNGLTAGKNLTLNLFASTDLVRTEKVSIASRVRKVFQATM